MNHFDTELGRIADTLKEIAKYRELRDEANRRGDLELARVYAMAVSYLGEEFEGKCAKFGRYFVNTLESQKWEMFAPEQKPEQA